MTRAELHDLVAGARQAFNRGDMAGYIDALYAPGAHLHYLPPDLPAGQAGVRAYYDAFHRAFPDARFTLEQLLFEDDLAALRHRLDMTHRGDFLGVAASGRRVSMTGISILRLADGRCVERWTESDTLGLLRQLGATPAPPA